MIIHGHIYLLADPKNEGITSNYWYNFLYFSDLQSTKKSDE